MGFALFEGFSVPHRRSGQVEKYNGKRKDAAKELGISERTLYRKINEFGIK